MDAKSYFRAALGLSSAGAIFSGYLSGVKLFSGSCAFSEPCPYFLGYPACWYGFAMFLVLLGLASSGRFGGMKPWSSAWGVLAVSMLGTAFAGSFIVQELRAWFVAGHANFYGFGLPSCFYGLVFYAALLMLSASFILRKKDS